MLIDIYGNHPDLDGFRFCKKIMRQYHPDNKPHINHVCIKNGYAYATDGHRLNSFKCECHYTEGLYAITICRVNFVQIAKSQYGTSQYPKTEFLFDTDGYIELDRNRYFNLNGIYYCDAVYHLNRYGIKVNPKYVSDIGGDCKIIVTTDEKRFDSKSIIFLNGKKRAAIMPMRT